MTGKNVKLIIPFLLAALTLLLAVSCGTGQIILPSNESESPVDTVTTPSPTAGTLTETDDPPDETPDGKAVEWCRHEHQKAAGDKKATCVSDGYKDRMQCTDCGAVLDDTGVIIPAYGHEYNMRKCIHCSKNKPSLASSGQFGNTGVIWQLFDDGELSVSGKGAIPSFPENENGYFFPFNKAVKSIVILNGVTAIGDNVFRGLKDVTSISVSSSVRSIGDHAFDGWSLKTLDLSYGVIRVGKDNFMDNQLFFLELPSSIRSVGAGSFASQQMFTLRIPESVTTYDAYDNQYSNLRNVAFMGDESTASKLGLYRHLTRDGECATVFLHFRYTGKASSLPYCTKRGRVDGDFTFAVFTDDTALVTAYRGASTNVEIPEKLGAYTVFGIEHECFKNNKTIRSVTLPATLTVLNYKAFVDCSSLEELTIKGNGKVRVGANAFSGCSSLKALNFEGTFLDLGAGSFAGTSIRTLRPDPDMKIARVSSFASARADEVDFRQFSVICDSAFARCALPAEIDLTGVSEIGYGAFYGGGLTSLNVTNVGKIARAAFRNNSGLNASTVTGLETVTDLDENAFDFKYLPPPEDKTSAQTESGTNTADTADTAETAETTAAPTPAASRSVSQNGVR